MILGSLDFRRLFQNPGVRSLLMMFFKILITLLMNFLIEYIVLMKIIEKIYKNQCTKNLENLEK